MSHVTDHEVGREKLYGYVWDFRGDKIHGATTGCHYLTPDEKAVPFDPWPPTQEAVIKHLKSQEMDGVFVIQPNEKRGGIGEVGKNVAEFGKRCRDVELDMILAFTGMPPGAIARDKKWRAKNIEEIDLTRLDYVMSITNRLAVGSSTTEEWGGHKNDANLAYAYKEMAEKYGYEWICTLQHGEVVRDLKSRKLKEALGDTLCVCLCGHILAGYVFADFDIPDQREGSFMGRDLYKDYGLDFETLRDYVKDMNIWSGAGHQGGLNNGSRVYLIQKLGFNGLVMGLPVVLKGTDKVFVFPSPEIPPVALGCGHFDGRCYRRRADLGDSVGTE